MESNGGRFAARGFVLGAGLMQKRQRKDSKPLRLKSLLLLETAFYPIASRFA